MAREPWFGPNGLALYRSDFLDHHEGWQKYIEDSVITAGEILEQEVKIAGMLKAIEPKLSDELHGAVAKILLEYEVLVNMALIHYPTVMERREFWTLPQR